MLTERLTTCGHSGPEGLCGKCLQRELVRCKHAHVDPHVLPWCTQCGAYWREGIGWTGAYVAHEAYRLQRSVGENPLVYLESPFTAPTAEGRACNRRYLLACLKDSTSRGERPFASHLFYTQFLDDDVLEERQLGIACGLAWAAAATLTVVYLDLGMSGGMQLGVEDARRVGRPVISRYLPGWSG